MDVQRATLESMGMRSKKAVAIHILQENVYESNLVPDIANVDYLAGHQGRTNLQPLAGLQVFVDDVYVLAPCKRKTLFGYLAAEHLVLQAKRVQPKEW